MVDVKEGIEVIDIMGDELMLAWLLSERLAEPLPETLGLPADRLVMLREALTEMLAAVLDIPTETLVEML